MNGPAWLKVLNSEVVACTRCPRLVAYREQIAREKRRGGRLPDHLPPRPNPPGGAVVEGGGCMRPDLPRCRRQSHATMGRC